MTEFKPILRKPGEIIKSEEWNRIQEGLMADIIYLEEKIRTLKEYVDNMSERITLIGLESPVGRSFGLAENVPGESSNYRDPTMGLITKQWVPSVLGEGEICHFGITDYFDLLYYWSGADLAGDEETPGAATLDITLEYIDDTIQKISENTYINNRKHLSEASTTNPYIEFLYNDFGVWYKYQVRNPTPEKEVRYIKFRNTNADCNPRIGNVIQLKTRVQPLSLDLLKKQAT